jgi:hypothetical protein
LGNPLRTTAALCIWMSAFDNPVYAQHRVFNTQLSVQGQWAFVNRQRKVRHSDTKLPLLSDNLKINSRFGNLRFFHQNLFIAHFNLRGYWTLHNKETILVEF